jgi:hypothetical protein
MYYTSLPNCCINLDTALLHIVTHPCIFRQSPRSWSNNNPVGVTTGSKQNGLILVQTLASNGNASTNNRC